MTELGYIIILFRFGGSVLYLSKRGFAAAAISVGVVAATAGTGIAQAAQQQPAAAQPHTSSVIVVLRDQHTGVAANTANAAAQAPLLSRARSLGATHLHGFRIINAFSATVTPAQEASLAAHPAVAIAKNGSTWTTYMAGR